MWTHAGRESGPNEWALVTARARLAARWLLGHEHEGEHVAVVSHQVFLKAFTAVLEPPGLDPAAAERLRARFRNAERRTYILCERESNCGDSGSTQPTDSGEQRDEL